MSNTSNGLDTCLNRLPPEMRHDTAFMDRIHAYLPGWDVPKLDRSFFTDHFGLVNDFLSDCWSQLRSENRLSSIQGRVQFGGALSGRDTTAVHRTLDGLLKLLYPDREAQIPDKDIEWAVRLALESRRRVKEQQKRIGSAEFRNTHFSLHHGRGWGRTVRTLLPNFKATRRLGQTRFLPDKSGRSALAGLTTMPVSIASR